MKRVSRNINTLVNEDIAKLATGASVSMVGKIMGRGSLAVMQIVLARFLGPELFGLYALGYTILRVGELLGHLGLNNGVIHFGSSYWGKDNRNLKRVLYQSIGYAFLSGTLIGALLFLSAPWLAVEVFAKPELTRVLRWFAPAFPLVAGLRVAAAATRISERIIFTVYAEDLLQPLASLFFVGVVYLLGLGLGGAVLASTLSFALAFALALYYVRLIFSSALNTKGYSRRDGKELLLYSLPTAFSGLFTLLTMWIDRLLVGYFQPTSDVGIYQAASQTAMLFGVILTAFNVIFAPMIARLYYSGAKERLAEMYKVSTKWGLYISLPIFLVVLFASGDVMTLIYGAEYQRGAIPLTILSTAQLINAGTGAVGFILIMTGRQQRWLAISAIMFFLDLGLNLMLIPKMGIVGAAIGTAFAVAGLFVLALIQVKYELDLWPYDKRYFKGLLATITTVTIILLVRLIPMPIFFFVALIFLFSIITFAGILILLGLDGEDIELVRLVQLRVHQVLIG